MAFFNANLTSSEISFLLDGGKISWLDLKYTNIKDKKNKLITVDKTLEKVPKFRTFFYACENEIFINETFEKMCDLKFDANFNHFGLKIYKLFPDADITILSKFMKSTDAFRSYFFFDLCIDNSEEHKLKLEYAIDEMCQTKYAIVRAS